MLHTLLDRRTFLVVRLLLSSFAAVDGDKGALSRTADEAEASTFFPTFLWVLRDFTLDLVADDGFTSITPHEYLDECLAQTASGFSTEAQVGRLWCCGHTLQKWCLPPRCWLH